MSLARNTLEQAKENQHILSSSFANFFNGIAAYIVAQKGMLVFGEDPALHKRAIEKMKGAGHLIQDLWEDYEKGMMNTKETSGDTGHKIMNKK